MRLTIAIACLTGLFSAGLAFAQTITVIEPFAGSTLSSTYQAEFDQVTIFVDDGDGVAQQTVEGEVRAAVYTKPEGKAALEV
ncbi:MAG: hypothetical protein AAGJ39_10145, partial [Pseudomonadota bacterium]